MSYRLHYSEVDSTQKVAIALAKEGAREGICVVSAAQTDGHGRNGQPWYSPAGGLYLSIVLHPDPMGLHLLSLTAGLEILSELSNVTSTDLKLKWPNDIVIDAEEAPGFQKLAGVLTDVVNPNGVLPVAVLGVGVNVRRVHFPPELASRVAFLEDLTEKPVAPDALEEPIIEAVLRASQRISSADERADIAAELNRILWGLGRPVSIEGIAGELAGVGASGEAILKTSTGQESFWTGELALRRK